MSWVKDLTLNSRVFDIPFSQGFENFSKELRFPKKLGWLKLPRICGADDFSKMRTRE